MLIFSDFCLWLLKLKSLDYTYSVENDTSCSPPKASDCRGCVLGHPTMWDAVQRMSVGLSSQVRRCAVCLLPSLFLSFAHPRCFKTWYGLMSTGGAHQGLQVLGWSPDLMQRQSTAEDQGPCPHPHYGTLPQAVGHSRRHVEYLVWKSSFKNIHRIVKTSYC